MLKNMLSSFFAVIGAFINNIFGKFSWSTPPWINYLCGKATTQPKVFWGKIAGALLLLIVIFFIYHWYESRPQPERIIAQLTTPKLTPNDKVLIPNPLILDFGTQSQSELHARSVAPLKSVGKEVTEGISITPNLPGKWAWESDSRLVFQPSIDWPAGQTYTIKFNPSFFAKHINMAKWSYTFTTLPFEAIITSFKFYQDPINPQLRQAVATINFSYPVDPNSFENKVALSWESLKTHSGYLPANHFKYTINYDENKRIAYIRSESLTLPPVERYLDLTLAKGIKAAFGPSSTTEDTKASVIIPDVGSFFKVSHAASSIVRNEKDRPEQVLTLETTLGVTEAELKKSLHVYVLPKDYPATLSETAKQNYEWKDPGEVTPAILALAKPLALQALPADRDYATLHSYSYHVATPAYLYVKLDKGVHGFGHFVLTQDFVAIIPVPEYPQEISFLHKGALLALGTEEKLSVLVRGLAAVKFDIARVLPDDVNHLITQTSGDFSNPSFIDPNFNQDNISEIFSQTQPFDASDPAKEQYTALDLGKYLSAKSDKNGALGLFLLQARGWDSAKNIPLNVKTNRLVLITDLGLLVKDNHDGTHDIFVESITKGTPVKSASVSILGKNGVAIFTRETDAQGHATFPTLNDFTNEREPTVYVVKFGNDVSFIPYNRPDRFLNFSRFDVGGVTTDEQNQSALTAYLFSDRGIYRPGDTAHIGMIVKRPFVLPQQAGLLLEATIVNPRGITVKDEKLTLNDSGFLTLDFQTNATSGTGQYFVYLYIVKDNHPSSLIGSMAINVAEFLPDRMRITAHLSEERTQGWVSPKGLAVNVGLSNLYGAPAANHRVGGKILLSPQAVTFKTFPKYTFIDPLFNPKAPPKIFTDTLADVQTDEKGQAVLDLKLDRFQKATYQLTVFVEGFEAEGGRSVTTQASALVSPLNTFVGYKPDGDLRYINQKGVRKVNFIAVDPELKQIALSNIKLQLFSQRPVTTLVKRDDGTYQYQSILQTKEVSSNPFIITNKGSDYTLPTEQIGDFLVTIVDQAGSELSRFKYSVVGNSQQPLPKNAELEVKLNKSEFAPGEDIEMQITSPYTGSGLITIERDKVYNFAWFKADTTSSVQKIHIPNDFQGDGYVNIAFVRDLNSPEIFMSPLSYSVVPFAVTHQNHEIKVDLATPTLARPGQFFDITYNTDKASKIVVFAVDEGILQVTQFASPDPIKFFFQKHALAVNTLQIVDQILPKFMADRELSAVGGDNGEAALRKNLNPFKRKTEAPVVYWSGIIDADTTPRQLVYQIPDYFNGSLRVMAVAVSPDAVGAANTSANVRGYFVINPNVPTFVAPNDEFDITASVANNVESSGQNATVKVNLTTTSQLAIIGQSAQSVTIPEGQERSVRFRVRAKSLLGSAELKFTANLNDKSSSISSTLSVRPASPYLTTMTSGYSKDSTKSLTLDRDLYSEYRLVEVAASQSPLILINGLQRYLSEYPYGCTEQLVSKAFPLLAMANQPWFATDAGVITHKVEQTIQMLGQRQMSNGGFNYWPETGSREGNDFASVYAMHFLTEAKSQGYHVPSDLYSAGIGFLKELATRDVTNLDEARLHAYAIYLLTRNEIVTTNYLTHLQLVLNQHPDFHWQQDITSAYIAATYQLLKSTKDADKLISLYKPQSGKAAETTDFYNQNIADAQYLYLIAHHFPDRLQKINSNYIQSLVNALNSDTISTVLSSYTSLALAAYGQFYPTSANATLSITETLNNSALNALSAANGLYQHAAVDEAAQSVTFNNPSKQGYFYQLVQTGFDKNLPKEALNQGIEVYRELKDANDNIIDTIPLGDEITVHIRARSIDNQYHSNIAMVDLLPGGFEVVRDSVTSKNVDYVDVREDRVIFFGSVNPDSFEIVYRMKATNIGSFAVPPMFAMAMYNPQVKSLGVASMMHVKEPT